VIQVMACFKMIVVDVSYTRETAAATSMDGYGLSCLLDLILSVIL
jgi:hypothetical protein